jgi:hypothetical protein
MKKHLFILTALLLWSVIVTAQTETNSTTDNRQDMQTLFGSTQHIGWWVSPDFAWTQIDSKDAFLGGLSGGIIVNHVFSIGVAGYGIMNSSNFRYSGIMDNADVYLYGGYGGLKLEYRLFGLNMVNVGFPLLIGGGAVTYSTWGPDNWNHSQGNMDYVYAWDSFFAIEPGVVVGINILKFMRLDAGVSYRYAPGIDLPQTNSDLLNTLNVNMSLKFGRF